MKPDAEYKRNQRLRDKLLLEKIGFNSIEGVMSAIRGLDEYGLKQLQAILRRRNEPYVKAKDKARPQAKRTR